MSPTPTPTPEMQYSQRQIPPADRYSLNVHYQWYNDVITTCDANYDLIILT